MADTETISQDSLLKPSLDSLSENQVSAIRKIPSHDEARIPKLDAQRPVEIFNRQGAF